MAIEEKRMQSIKATALGWSIDNIVLLDGEIGVEIDGGAVRLKVGDGVSAFADLVYVAQSDISGLVQSVHARTGAVVAVAGDYDADQISETPTRIFFTSAEASKLFGIDAGADVSPIQTVFGRVGDILAAVGDYNADLISETAARIWFTGAERLALQTVTDNPIYDVANTGLVSGGVTTQSGVLMIDITAGQGNIINPVSGTATVINFTEKLNHVITNIPPAGEYLVYIGIDISGNISEKPTARDGVWIRANIQVGVLFLNSARTDILFLATIPIVARNVAQSAVEYILNRGVFKIRGGVLSANGPNLSFDVTSLLIFSLGANWRVDPLEPNVVTIPGATPAEFSTILGNGTIAASGVTELDVGNYDDGSAAPVPVPNNKFTNQYIFAFGTSEYGVVYGQSVHDNINDAANSIATDFFVLKVPTWLRRVGLLVGVASVKNNATDLTDSSEALLVSGGEPLTDGAGLVDVSALQPTNTGVTLGGLMSKGAGDLDLTITDGSGVILNSYSNPGQVVKTNVNWASLTDQLLSDPGADNNIIFILISSVGAIVELPDPPSSKERRDNIYLGYVVLNAANTLITSVSNTPLIAFSSTDNFIDASISQSGIRKVEGGTPQPNGSNLSFDITSALIFGLGINWHTDQSDPNFLVLASQSPTTFLRAVVSGGVVAGPVTLLDPANIDDGAGGLTAIGGNDRRSSNQFIFGLGGGSFVVFYGTVEYTSLGDAVNNVDTEVGTINFPDEVTEAGFFVGTVSMEKSATDLSEISQAFFKGAAGTALGGGGGSVTPDPLDINVFNALAEVNVFGVGLPGDADTELLTIDYDSGPPVFSIQANATGTGVVRDLVLQAGGGNVGIGIATAPTARLHVSEGVSGVTPLSLADTAFFESDANAGITISAPDLSIARLVLSTPGNSLGAFLSWDFTADRFLVVTGGELKLDAPKIVFDAGGLQSILTIEDQAFGFATSTPNYADLSASFSVLTVGGELSSGAVEIATSAADGDAVVVGDYMFSMPTNTGAASLRVAFIRVRTQGGVANDRGGSLHFHVKEGENEINPNSPQMQLNNEGRLGVGAATVDEHLHVEALNASGPVALQVENTSPVTAANQEMCSIKFRHQVGSGTQYEGSKISSHQEDGGTVSRQAYLSFYTAGPTPGDLTEKARLDNDGLFRVFGLAGTGTRNVVVDANGVMSAP